MTQAPSAGLPPPTRDAILIAAVYFRHPLVRSGVLLRETAARRYAANAARPRPPGKTVLLVR